MWEEVLDVGIGVTNVVRIGSGPSVWAGGENAIFAPWIAKSVDKGETWELMFPELGGDNACNSIAVHPYNPAIVYAGMEGAVIKTVDGGKTWDYTGLRDTSVYFYGLAIDSGDPAHIYAGGTISPNSFAFYESVDGGAHWWQYDGTWTLFAPQGITSMVADPQRPAVVYLATLNGVWRYTSALLSYFPMQVGNRWTFSVSEFSSTTISDTITETIIDTIRIADSLYFYFDHFSFAGDAFLRLISGNKLLVKGWENPQQLWVNFSAAVGDTWTVSSPEEYLYWTVRLQSRTDTVIVPAGTFTNCCRFDFQAAFPDASWAEWYAPGVGPVKRISFGAIVYEYLLVGARVNGRDYPTRVERSRDADFPEHFLLHPNYPNPFNATTMIRYDLPAPALVRLEIYSLLGQKVRTLLSERKSAGQHQVLWDGRDDAGNSLPSGVYLYRLSAGEFVAAKRMVLMR